MKKIKLITAVVAALVCMNFVFAVSPLKGNADKLAAIMVEKVNADVQMTDSQKTIMLVKAKEFAITMQIANSKTSKDEKSFIKKDAYQKYNMSLDSLLTDEQRNQLKVKRTERKTININKGKSNN